VIFIDTGAFLARYLRNDQHHRSAVVVWDKLGSNRNKCVTSNFVLDETFTLLGRCAGYDFAVQRAKNIYASQALTIYRPDRKECYRNNFPNWLALSPVFGVAATVT
jgi:predicted nucleic acid-binding protein